jgi:TPR repeat protein
VHTLNLSSTIRDCKNPVKFQLITTWQVRKSGKCVARDYAEAVWLYRLASAQGHAAAQTTLGTMFERGRDAKVASEAINLHRFAAAQGISQDLAPSLACS